MSADFSKIGRNNKNRGREFEREVADRLRWTRVPYSGGVKEWGGGDVADGYRRGKGFWSAECKTQKATNTRTIRVKNKWIEQMFNAADGTGRYPLLIVKLVGATTPGKKSDWWVLLPLLSYKMLEGMEGCEDYTLPLGPHRRTKVSGEENGFIVKDEWLQEAKRTSSILHLEVDSFLGLGRNVVLTNDWYIMHVDEFHFAIDKLNAMVYEEPDNG